MNDRPIFYRLMCIIVLATIFSSACALIPATTPTSPLESTSMPIPTWTFFPLTNTPKPTSISATSTPTPRCPSIAI